MATLTPTVSISHENEMNPWLAANARFDDPASRLKLDDGTRKVLGTPSRELVVHIPVQLDDGRLEVFTGYRVQHSVANAVPLSAIAWVFQEPEVEMFEGLCSYQICGVVARAVIHDDHLSTPISQRNTTQHSFQRRLKARALVVRRNDDAIARHREHTSQSHANDYEKVSCNWN